MILSITKIKSFKSCRRLYQLRYVEGLKPVQRAEALEIGSNYHSLLEQMYIGGYDSLEPECTKERAMAEAYKKYIYPKFKVAEVEKYLEYDLGIGDKLIGYADGISVDGVIVEHKTCSREITEQYEYDLLWDEQILAYMLMTGSRKVWYTVCRKPTIKLKKDETEEEFYQRMLEWYDTDTDSKIRLLEIERTDDEVEQFKADLEAMRYEMKNAEISDKHRIVKASPFYRNTCHCNMWGRRCEYSSVCLNYQPNAEYIDFIRKENDYAVEKN